MAGARTKIHSPSRRRDSEQPIVEVLTDEFMTGRLFAIAATEAGWAARRVKAALAGRVGRLTSLCHRKTLGGAVVVEGRSLTICHLLGTISSDERMVKCALQETYGNEETNSARYEMAGRYPGRGTSGTPRQGTVCSVSAGPVCLLRHDAISFNNESAC